MAGAFGNIGDHNVHCPGDFFRARQARPPGIFQGRRKQESPASCPFQVGPAQRGKFRVLLGATMDRGLAGCVFIGMVGGPKGLAEGRAVGSLSAGGPAQFKHNAVTSGARGQKNSSWASNRKGTRFAIEPWLSGFPSKKTTKRFPGQREQKKKGAGQFHRKGPGRARPKKMGPRA